MSADLPNDPARLQAQLDEANRHREDLLAQNRLLELKVRSMEAKIQALLQQYFGRSSEQLDPNQLKLALGSVFRVTLFQEHFFMIKAEKVTLFTGSRAQRDVFG